MPSKLRVIDKGAIGRAVFNTGAVVTRVFGFGLENGVGISTRGSEI